MVDGWRRRGRLGRSRMVKAWTGNAPRRNKNPRPEAGRGRMLGEDADGCHACWMAESTQGPRFSRRKLQTSVASIGVSAPDTR